MIQLFDSILTRISVQLIKLYQLILSPDKGIPSMRLKGRVCRHEPHCSQYALEHMRRFGFFRSIVPIMDRVSNCTAGVGKIIDPVPNDPTTSNSKTLKHGNIETLKPLRVVFFSSAPIGVPFLESLRNDERFEVVGVVTQPDQPAGRGLEMKPSIIKKFALRFLQEHCNIERLKSAGVAERHSNSFIQTPNTLKLDSKKYPGEGEEFYQWLQNLQADYFVVTAYGKLMPQFILDIPKIAPVNIHRSLLPQYRGATPIQTALLNGDKQTGMTLIIMNSGMDEGDIIGTKSLELEPNTNSEQLYDMFATIGPGFVNDTLADFAAGKIQAQAQDHNKATFVHKIEKEQGLISPFENNLEQILRKYNGYYGWPKIYFMFKDKRVIIEQLEIDLNTYDDSKSTLLINNENNLNPAVTQLLLKPEGKKAISREDRKRGYLKTPNS